ncbi:unnamed protein product [Rhodiola kirilowii]
MAGISRRFPIAELRNRLVVNVFAAGSGRLAAFSAEFRRNTHESVYEKNVEDQLNPTIVPDDVIKPESDKYWAPNPNTGVFGPESDTQPGGATKGHSTAGQNSVLEEKAWFRPTSLEDLEKASP